MKSYLLRRLLQAVPILLAATMLIFLVIRLAPGDPFTGMIDPQVDPRRYDELRQRYCLDCPLPEQYGRWLVSALRGDLGESIRFKVPVAGMIGERLGPTLLLGLSAQLIAYGIGIPLGVIAARRADSPVDLVATVGAFAGISLPSFFLGLLLLRTFSLGALHWLPSSGLRTPGGPEGGPAAWIDIGRHLILPAIALGVTGVASLMRYVRSAMVEVLRQDFVRTAQAKGLAERVVVFRHALRNAMIPVVTLMGLSLPSLVGGAIITESLFIWPGIGRLTYTALLERDYPVLMALNLMFATLTLAGSLLADIGYAAVDPRVRYD